MAKRVTSQDEKDVWVYVVRYDFLDEQGKVIHSCLEGIFRTWEDAQVPVSQMAACRRANRQPMYHVYCNATTLK
jgi:hypothetical protein